MVCREIRGERVEESSHEDVRGGRRVAVVVGHERLDGCLEQSALQFSGTQRMNQQVDFS